MFIGQTAASISNSRKGNNCIQQYNEGQKTYLFKQKYLNQTAISRSNGNICFCFKHQYLGQIVFLKQ